MFKKIIIILLLSQVAKAQIPEKDIFQSEIVNYKKVNEKLATAGLLNDNALEELKQNNFQTIIDLRTPLEFTTSEKNKAKELGLNYINIPIYFEIEDKHIDEFAKAYEGNNDNIMLHCRVGSRVGALWALYEIKKGSDPKTTLAKAKKIGLGYFLEKKVVSKCKEILNSDNCS